MIVGYSARQLPALHAKRTDATASLTLASRGCVLIKGSPLLLLCPRASCECEAVALRSLVPSEQVLRCWLHRPHEQGVVTGVRSLVEKEHGWTHLLVQLELQLTLLFVVVSTRGVL